MDREYRLQSELARLKSLPWQERPPEGLLFEVANLNIDFQDELDRKPNLCSPDEIPMNSKIVQQIVEAFIGPPHLMKELQAIAVPYIPNNPIAQFIQAYSDGKIRSMKALNMEEPDDIKAWPTHPDRPDNNPRAEECLGEITSRLSGSKGED